MNYPALPQQSLKLTLPLGQRAVRGHRLWRALAVLRRLPQHLRKDGGGALGTLRRRRGHGKREEPASVGVLRRHDELISRITLP